MKRTILFAACILLLFGNATISAGQTSTPATEQPKTSEMSTEDASLLLDIFKAYIEARHYALAPDSAKDKAGSANTLAELYAKAVKRPLVMKSLLGGTYSDYLELKEGARGAAQVSQAADEASVKFQLFLVAQNQALIQQNDRIINLLEQLVRKR